MKNPGRTPIDLKSPLCTDNPTGSDTYPFSADPTQVVENTGIERNGGVTAQFEQETTFNTPGANSIITTSGDLLQVDASYNVRLNDVSLGNVGPWTIASRNKIPGYSDAAWTSDGYIIGIVKIGNAIRVDKIDPATMTVSSTRSTTFSMPPIAIVNISLVKYVGMQFSDNLQFVISNNISGYILSESGTSVVLIGGVVWTTKTLTGATWNGMCWSPAKALFCAVGSNGANSAATSSDGSSWAALGLATSGGASGPWYSVCWSPEKSLFVAVGGTTGGVQNAGYSSNGTSWPTSLVGATPLNSDKYTGVAWSSQLGIFAAVGQGGDRSKYAMSSTDGTSWTERTLAAGNWNSICWSADKAIFVAVGGDATANAFSSNGTSWTKQANLPAGTWNSVCWSKEKGIFVAVSSTTNYCATSTDGSAWSVRTLAAGNWKSVIWSATNGIFIAVGNGGTNYSAYSSDGITWIVASLEANNWNAVSYSSELNLFSAVGNGATHYAASGTLGGGKINFAWKFEANRYILGAQGLSGVWYVGDPAATITQISDSAWAIIDIFQGTVYSRAILTFPVKKNGSNLLTGIGEVGHNQAGTYNATPTYYGVALAAVTVTIGTHAEGPGYSEATFTRSDDSPKIYYYIAPVMGHNTGTFYDYQQSQTQTQCNGYGKLTDIQGNTLGVAPALRQVMIAGVPSFLSVAAIGQESTIPLDCLGVPVTNLGEWDETFVPHVVDDGSTKLRVIYRYNGVLFFFIVQSGASHTISRVSDNTYMVNCISPINAVDVAAKSMTLGVNDYNGRILFRSSAAIIPTTKVVGIMQGIHANSIDAGDKLITQTFSTATSIIPGIEIPSFIDRQISDYGVNVYVADTYSASYLSFNVTFANSLYSGTIYVNDTRIPFGMGYTFGDRTMATEIETVLVGVGSVGRTDINYDYLCYETGNDITGNFSSFILYGQTYLYDGYSVWAATFTGSLLSTKQIVCQGEGLTYIGASPSEAYFLSLYDGSLYTFNGGRNLTKSKRFNDIRNTSNGIETIINGVYSTRDDTIVLQTPGNFIWIRDGVVTETFKKANQTGLSIYRTASGIVIANNANSWTYDFRARGTTTSSGGAAVTTVVPLKWQSAYHAMKGNELSCTTSWISTFYSPEGNVSATITMRCHAFDQDGYSVNRADFAIMPSDWDALGFIRLRIQPQKQKALASSLQIDTTSHLVITDVSVEYGDEAPATISAARSA